MPIEKPEPLSEEAAHEEANMVRAKLGVSPETGKIEGLDMREDHEPTAEDYDKALAAVEELKRIAEEEPASLKVMAKVSNAMEMLVRIPGLGVMFLTRVSHALIGPEPGGPKERWKRNEVLTDLVKEFDDAESQLRRLKAKGERFGKRERQSQGNSGH